MSESAATQLAWIGLFSLGLISGALLGVLSLRFLQKRQQQQYVDSLEQSLKSEYELKNAQLQTRNDGLSAQLQEHKLAVQNLRQSEQQLLADSASMKTLIEQQRQHNEEKLQLLEQAKKKLELEFNHLANRIFDEKSEKLHRHNQQVLDTTLSPLREQLKDFRKKVEDVYDKEAKERHSLLHEICQLKDLNQQMSRDAMNLTKALKGESKTQGNWGEIVLETVLQESGLRKGHEYDTQVSLNSTEGKRRYPDVIIRLPDDKDIIIDAKVSLLDYERYCSSEEEDVRQEALKAHIQSIRTHIQGLSIKEYEKLEGIRTLDFVFIFIPIESAFLLAVEHDQTMFRDAYSKNIIVVSPTTLLATLRTVESIWRYERQNINAEKIALKAGQLHDQFVLVLDAFEELGRHLSKSQEAFDLTLNRFSLGKGNLVNRVSALEKLGAKTKKRIPKKLLERADTDETDEDLLLDSTPLAETLSEELNTATQQDISIQQDISTQQDTAIKGERVEEHSL